MTFFTICLVLPRQCWAWPLSCGGGLRLDQAFWGHSHKLWSTFVPAPLEGRVCYQPSILQGGWCSSPTTEKQAWLKKKNSVQTPYPLLLGVFARVSLTGSGKFSLHKVSRLPPKCSPNSIDSPQVGMGSGVGRDSGRKSQETHNII